MIINSLAILFTMVAACGKAASGTQVVLIASKAKIALL